MNYTTLARDALVAAASEVTSADGIHALSAALKVLERIEADVKPEAPKATEPMTIVVSPPPTHKARKEYKKYTHGVTRGDIIAVHAAHPRWTARRVCQELDISTSHYYRLYPASGRAND